MTSKEKKEYGILTVLVLGIFFVIYSNFIKKDTPTPDAGLAPDALGVVPEQTFLPHGTAFETGILQDKKFKNLTPPSYPQVDRSEIGVVNPFGQ